MPSLTAIMKFTNQIAHVYLVLKTEPSLRISPIAETQWQQRKDTTANLTDVITVRMSAIQVSSTIRKNRRKSAFLCPNLV